MAFPMPTTSRLQGLGKRDMAGRQGPAVWPPVDQALATCKHWSAYSLEGQIKPTPSGPAGTYPGRHQFDAVISKQDLVDFYFPVFESCSKDANVASVMCTISTVKVACESIR